MQTGVSYQAVIYECAPATGISGKRGMKLYFKHWWKSIKDRGLEILIILFLTKNTEKGSRYRNIALNMPFGWCLGFQGGQICLILMDLVHLLPCDWWTVGKQSSLTGSMWVIPTQSISRPTSLRHSSIRTEKYKQKQNNNNKKNHNNNKQKKKTPHTYQ